MNSVIKLTGVVVVIHLVVVGGVIPPDDYPALRAAGAAEIFGPGTVIAEAAGALLSRLEEAT